jgi:hypothetical protein
MGTGIRLQTTYHHLSGESVTLRQSDQNGGISSGHLASHDAAVSPTQ